MTSPHAWRAGHAGGGGGVTQAGGDERGAVTFPHTDTARRRPPITSPEYVHYRSCVALEGGSRAGVGGDHHQLCGPHPTPGPGGHRAGPRASAAATATARRRHRRRRCRQPQGRMSLPALLHYLISHDVRSALPRNNDMGTGQSHIVNSLTVAGCLMLLIFMWEMDSAFRFHAAFCASRSLSFSQITMVSATLSLPILSRANRRFHRLCAISSPYLSFTVSSSLVLSVWDLPKILSFFL